MKPILRHLQQTLFDTLKGWDICKDIELFRHTALNLEEVVALRLSSAHPLQLGISYPFPLETTPDLEALCWSQLSFHALLIQKSQILPKNHFLDLAENICFELSKQNFITESYECRFTLIEKQPWQWVALKHKTALQMRFVTQKFSTFTV